MTSKSNNDVATTYVPIIDIVPNRTPATGGARLLPPSRAAARREGHRHTIAPSAGPSAGAATNRRASQSPSWTGIWRATGQAAWAAGGCLHMIDDVDDDSARRGAASRVVRRRTDDVEVLPTLERGGAYCTVSTYFLSPKLKNKLARMISFRGIVSTGGVTNSCSEDRTWLREFGA